MACSSLCAGTRTDIIGKSFGKLTFASGSRVGTHFSFSRISCSRVSQNNNMYVRTAMPIPNSKLYKMLILRKKQNDRICLRQALYQNNRYMLSFFDVNDEKMEIRPDCLLDRYQLQNLTSFLRRLLYQNASQSESLP